MEGEMTEEILLTQSDYDELEAQRDELVSVKRKEVSQRLKEAISYGDLSENAEYTAAKDEQAELEAEITKLEMMMRNATIISQDDIKDDKVNVGLLVTVKTVDEKGKVKRGETETFEIVGSTGADPFAEPAKISNESAIASALLGHRKGDVVEVVVPDGVIHYKIAKIEKRKKEK